MWHIDIESRTLSENVLLLVGFNSCHGQPDSPGWIKASCSDYNGFRTEIERNPSVCEWEWHLIPEKRMNDVLR